MRVFITGATGFMGGRVAARLVSAGCEVVALVRDPERTGRLPEGVRAVAGDVTDRPSLERGMEGCEAVVHMAALVKRWAPEVTAFDRINVEGFRNVVAAAESRRIGRILYTSSFIALGPTDSRVADESFELPGRSFHNDYERTKCLADREARKAAERGVPLVVLYPGVTYGEGSLTDGNIVAQAGLKFLRRKIPATIGPGDRRQCFSLIDDVAEGHWLALRKAEPGSRYILGGENRTIRELFAQMEKATGIPAPRRSMPYWLGRTVGKMMRWRANLFGIEPELTDEEVGIYEHEWAYTSEKACRELGYRITAFEEGVGRLMRWLMSLEGGKPRARASSIGTEAAG